MTVRLSVCLCINRITQNHSLDIPEIKQQKMGLGLASIPFNFECDLNHRLDTKNIIQIFPFTNFMCFGGSAHFRGALDLALKLVYFMVYSIYLTLIGTGIPCHITFT